MDGRDSAAGAAAFLHELVSGGSAGTGVCPLWRLSSPGSRVDGAWLDPLDLRALDPLDLRAFNHLILMWIGGVSRCGRGCLARLGR